MDPQSETITEENVRKWLGLTQAEMAELMGVSQQMISHWERGRRQPGILKSQIVAVLGQWAGEHDPEQVAALIREMLQRHNIGLFALLELTDRLE